MILQALCQQYGLLAKTHKDLPKKGYCTIKVSFALVLNDEGTLTGILDLRNQEGKRRISQAMLVPIHPTRSAKKLSPYFLCDNSKYVLGNGGISPFQSFRKLHLQYLDAQHPVSVFLQSWEPEKLTENEVLKPYLKEIKKSTNLVFYLKDQGIYAHEDTEVTEDYLSSLDSDTDRHHGQCLVSGKEEALCQIHEKIKGVKGGNGAGTSLVAFNDSSFESYGKKQGENAPISAAAMFQYTTALNYMLSDHRYHSFLNEVTVVFWANRPGVYPGVLKALLPPSASEKEEAADDRNLAKDLILKLEKGLPLKHENIELNPDTEVFILGLSPNNGRLSVALWQVNTFQFFLQRIAAFYHDLEIIGGSDHLSLSEILLETIPQKAKNKKVSPSITKSFALSVFSGGVYPYGLYMSILGRIRADGDLNPVRAAMIKAYLVRKNRMMNGTEDITMALNENDPHISYQLGRLFAVLEKIQKVAANANLKSTIKDRYFASASATPITVFPLLLRLSSAHTAKLKSKIYWENKKSDILDKVGQEFPHHFTVEEQGRFMIGYYQQNKDLYTKKEDKING